MSQDLAGRMWISVQRLPNLLELFFFSVAKMWGPRSSRFLRRAGTTFAETQGSLFRALCHSISKRDLSLAHIQLQGPPLIARVSDKVHVMRTISTMQSTGHKSL